MSKPCPSCGSLDLDVDGFTNDLICQSCGAVVEERRLVAEVGFSEAGGKKSVIGQTVTFGFGTGVSASSKASRDQTIARGKKNIEAFASRLRISNALQDQALRVYNMAVDKHFNKVLIIVN